MELTKQLTLFFSPEVEPSFHCLLDSEQMWNKVYHKQDLDLRVESISFVAFPASLRQNIDGFLEGTNHRIAEW